MVSLYLVSASGLESLCAVREMFRTDACFQAFRKGDPMPIFAFDLVFVTIAIGVFAATAAYLGACNSL